MPRRIPGGKLSKHPDDGNAADKIVKIQPR
jgi:hypothetical protein